MERPLWQRLVFRAVLAAPFAWLGFKAFGLQDPGEVMTCVSMFVIAALIVAGPLSEMFGHVGGLLFYPSTADGIPGYSLACAETCLVKGRTEEALAECRRMLKFHPDQPRPALMEFAILWEKKGDPAAAIAALERAMSRMTDPAAKLRLHEDSQTLGRLIRAGGPFPKGSAYFEVGEDLPEAVRCRARRTVMAAPEE